MLDKNMKVFLATPAYSAIPHPDFSNSVNTTKEALYMKGIPVVWEYLPGCCYLPPARNKLIQKFRDTDYTDFIFLDADLAWYPQAMLQLLSHDADIVCGAYPLKDDTGGYPVYMKQDAQGRYIVDDQTGLMEAHYAPTGFMRIRRQVFDRFHAHFPDIYVDEWRDGKIEGTFLNFFDTVYKDRRWFGEDVNFCYQWQEAGGKILVDPHLDLWHYGMKAWQGNYGKFLGIKRNGNPNHPYPGNDIEGWMTLEEQRWLFDRASQIKSVAEIGCWKGRSTHAIVSGCKGQIHCIDPWLPITWVSGFGDDTQEKADTRFREFCTNITAIDPTTEDRVTISRMGSVEASKTVPDRSVDMVFIDGDHVMESVIQDICHWLPKVRKLICGHDYDYAGWPEVKRVVDGFFGDKVQTCETIWFVEID